MVPPRKKIQIGMPRRAEETTPPQLALVSGRKGMRRQDFNKRHIHPLKSLLLSAQSPPRGTTHGAPPRAAQTSRRSRRRLPVLLQRDGTRPRWLSSRLDVGITAQVMPLCEWAWAWACGPTQNRRTNTCSNKPLGRCAVTRSPGSHHHHRVRPHETTQFREAPCRLAPSGVTHRAVAVSRRHRLDLHPATQASRGSCRPPSHKIDPSPRPSSCACRAGRHRAD